MEKAIWLVLALGIVVAALGIAQFELGIALSGDAGLNPVLNDVILWLSWGVAGFLLAAGTILALLGEGRDEFRASHVRPNRRLRGSR